MKRADFVIVAADDGALGAVAEELLREADVRTEFCADGRDAIARLRRSPCAVLLVDLARPFVRGRDGLLRFLWERGQVRPIVIAVHDGGVIAGLDPAIVSLVLRKPFDREVLVHIVTAAVAAHRGEGVPHRPRIRHHSEYRR